MTEETLKRAQELQFKIKFFKDRIETITKNREFTIIFDKTFKRDDKSREFPDPATSIHSVCSPDGKNTAGLYEAVLNYYVSKLEEMQIEFENL